MEYAIDNTLTFPGLIVGLSTGDTYIVAPVGASGEWVGQENRVARLGDYVWTFTDAVAGEEYQILTGENAGQIYRRTGVAHGYVELVPNSEFLENPALFPGWALTAVGTTGAAVWITGGGNSAIDLSASASTDSASATVTVATVVGESYLLTWGISNVNDDPPAALSLLIRNFSGSVDMVTLDSENVNLGAYVFTATGAITTLRFRAASVSGGVASMKLDYVRLKRRPEKVVNGDFIMALSDFTPSAEWDTDFVSEQAPLVDEVAFALINYTGHTSTPALNQVITGLLSGQYYRISLDVVANFSRGIMTVMVDSTVLGDVGVDGTHDFYFKATSGTHTIKFPLTYIGLGPIEYPFELRMDNVSMVQALWRAMPTLKATLPGVGGLTALARVVRPSNSLMPAVGGLVGGSRRTRTSSASLPAVGSLSSGSAKGTSKPSGVITMPAVGGMRSGAAGIKFLSATLPGRGGLTAESQPLGYALVRDAVQRIVNLWGHPSCKQLGCDDPAVDEAVGKLNAAMQRLYSSGKEFGFVSTVPLTLTRVSGVAESVTLPRGTVSVKRAEFLPATNAGETTFSRFPLRPLTTRHEYESFKASAERDAFPLLAGEESLRFLRIPSAYYVEAEDDGTVIGIPSLRVMLAPVYDGTRTWKVHLQATVRPPVYLCSDVVGGTILAVPHNFAETLLIPLALYYALSSRYTVKDNVKDAILKQAEEVLGLLGDFTPTPKETERKGPTNK
jgi:hypothetical protein